MSYVTPNSTENGSKADRTAAQNVLPPVQAPTSSFVLQLFVIPLLIVAIICGVWFGFSWLSNASARPEEAIRGLERLDETSWRKAILLAELLRNPEYDKLKDDSSLAQRLGDILSAEIKKGETSDGRIKLRVFLCRALGEFRAREVIGPLAEAAQVERPNAPEEIDVRRAALEALSRYAGTLVELADEEGLRELGRNAEVNSALTKAAHEFGDDHPVSKQGLDASEQISDRQERERLRYTAAFTLGVIGGAENLDRLAALLDDPAANVRFNAATGLAKQGDARCVATIRQMLDVHNEDAIANETQADGRAWKRNQVIAIGLRAARDLLSRNHTVDPQPLIDAANQIEKDLPDTNEYSRIRLDAREMAIKLRDLSQGGK